VQYLLTLPIMVLAFNDNHQAAVTIPAGTLIEVVGPVEDDDRFLLIGTADGEFHIFASDLASRAEPLATCGTVLARSDESPAPKHKNESAISRNRRAVA